MSALQPHSLKCPRSTPVLCLLCRASPIRLTLLTLASQIEASPRTRSSVFAPAVSVGDPTPCVRAREHRRGCLAESSQHFRNVTLISAFLPSVLCKENRTPPAPKTLKLQCPGQQPGLFGLHSEPVLIPALLSPPHGSVCRDGKY